MFTRNLDMLKSKEIEMNFLTEIVNFCNHSTFVIFDNWLEEGLRYAIISNLLIYLVPYALHNYDNAT